MKSDCGEEKINERNTRTCRHNAIFNVRPNCKKK